MARSYEDHAARGDGGGDTARDIEAFRSDGELRQEGQRPQAAWAGVHKGRDGLLGRIETALGSIS